MGMADMTEVLYNDFLKHNPNNPEWFDRDRVVLSNGHGSMLLYAALHLSGYDLNMEDIRQFRQLHSKTPGHPEYGYTPGVETTTGPLGQGLANAVGMALTEKVLAAQFNRPGHNIVDHNTYVFLGDGCLMEGISHEACSLAGTLGLGKLIALYDDNNISIDGEVDGWFTDDTPARFTAYGWHVIANVDGHNADEVHQAIKQAKAVTDRPSLICCKTTIGFGSPNKAGTHDVHGAPLGEDEVAAARKKLGWEYPPFVIPDHIYAGWDARDKGAQAENQWQEKFAAYQAAHPQLAAEFLRRIQKKLPENWFVDSEAFIRKVAQEKPQMATRKASKLALEGFAPMLPELFGGSADLTPSNNTFWSGSRSVNDGDFTGNYLSYGVREFAMTAMMNGMQLHGGLRPYGATFLMFSEYARNAMRMAALMKIAPIFVYTHDSIGVGEDGPTHQPVEQLPTIRLIPNMSMWRPCDAVESAVAWQQAIQRNDGATTLVFTRQGVPHQDRTDTQIASIKRGGYILRDTKGTPDAIIIATGSEVSLAMEAASALEQEGVFVRVVSMPSTDRFDMQDDAYKDSVLPPEVSARVAVEAAMPDLWHKYVGLRGIVVGQTTFGESAPGAVLFKHFGFTPDNIATAVKTAITNAQEK